MQNHLVTYRSRHSLSLALAMLAFMASPFASARAQSNIQPLNSLPNPYQTIENWAKLPVGRAWGSTAGVAIDRRGHIWVAERCGANTCAGSDLPPILEFDSSGKLLESFGARMFIFPHGITVDKDGNVWVTDGQGSAEKATKYSNSVLTAKF